MKTRFGIALLLTVVQCLSFAQTSVTNRIALVIGVQNYSNVPPLRHSISDASDISAALNSKGFKVETIIDPQSKKEIREAITRYYNTMKSLSGAVGIIYYAGHGIQNEGENYLIPVAATLQVPGDLDDQCVKMNMVLSVLNSANSNLNIFLLDACRSNTFPSFSRDVSKGLANVEAPRGSIVVFATQPGTVASDGTGKNGLFTSKLLKYINEPNLNIGDVFKKVKQDVNVESGGKQLPSVVDNSIGGDFYFTIAEESRAPSSSSAVSEKQTNEEKSNVSSGLDYGYGTANAPIVKIGSQVWLETNLNLDHFLNGDPIPEARNSQEWGSLGSAQRPAWCYFNFDSKNGAKYGKLYNWYAIQDKRGLAPKGWHIPSEKEWKDLEQYLGGDVVATRVLRSKAWRNYSGYGDNASGFTALPGGIYPLPKYWWKDWGLAGWWTSTEKNKAYSIGVRLEDAFSISDYGKETGLSVRCLKD